MKPFIAILLFLGFAPPAGAYSDTGSPRCVLRILDQDGKPVAGLRVEREWRWDGSDDNRGKDGSVTDTNGCVSFQKITIHRSVAGKVFKPLLVFVPSPCGPGEAYAMTQFRIGWPGRYDLKFPSDKYRHINEVFQDKDGTCIRDPKVIEHSLQMSKRDLTQNYVEVYFFNRKTDFDFTLTVYKKSEDQK